MHYYRAKFRAEFSKLKTPGAEILFSPKALVFFAEGADSKSRYLEMDASLAADSFEIGKLRLSAF